MLSESGQERLNFIRMVREDQHLADKYPEHAEKWSKERQSSPYAPLVLVFIVPALLIIGGLVTLLKYVCSLLFF